MTRRIVVGVDGSESSRQALHWAAEEARLRDADLDVVFAWHHPEANFVPAYGLPAQEELEQQARDNAERLLAEYVDARSDGREVNAIVAQGRAAPLLLETAKGADLLVVGSRGRGGFTGMLLGSVSQHCVSHAPCPVVVIRGADDD